MKKHVLVVDDSPTDRQLVTTLLQREGYSVTTAVDGEDALDKVAAERPPLIVLDIILPKMNGYQVLRQLKTAPETRDIKVILVSSKSQESDRFWGLKQGADDYIAKPYPDADAARGSREVFLMDGVALGSTATLDEAVAAADRQLGRPAAVMATVARGAAKDAVQGKRYVLLSIASADYAVLEAFVTELERVPKITPVPHVPAWMRGVTNLRGDILSVIDMRTFLGLDAALPNTGRMLVVRLLDEEFSAGLLVDSVDRIVAVSPDEIRSPASPLEGPLAAHLSGVCVIGERLVAVLDLEGFLRSPDIRQFDEPKEEERQDAQTGA